MMLTKLLVVATEKPEMKSQTVKHRLSLDYAELPSNTDTTTLYLALALHVKPTRP